MTLALSKNRIRLALDPLNHDPISCILQERKPIIWRGTDVDIEVGIFFDGTFVDDISNITSIILEIHNNSDRTGGALIQKTILAADMDDISSEEWISEAANKAHAVFELSNAETNFDMTGANQNKLQFWLVIHCVLTTGEYLTLGSTNLEVEEDAAQTGIPVLGTANGNFRVTSGGELQIKGKTTGKWYTAWIKEDVAGAEQIFIEEGES